MQEVSYRLGRSYLVKDSREGWHGAKNSRKNKLTEGIWTYSDCSLGLL